MLTTLLDNRNGNKSSVAPDVESKDSESHDQELENHAADILGAIERKSIPDLRDALKACFQYLDKQPHEEGEHVESEDAAD